MFYDEKTPIPDDKRKVGYFTWILRFICENCGKDCESYEYREVE